MLVKKIRGLTIKLKKSKTLFIRIQQMVSYIDSQWCVVFALNTILSICALMVGIYTLANIDESAFYQNYTHFLYFVSCCGTCQFIMCCYYFGLIETKVQTLNNVLDGMVDTDLSHNEYNEWILFKKIIRNTHSFGITIGGFAKFNKSTFIAVLYLKYKFNFYIK